MIRNVSRPLDNKRIVVPDLPYQVHIAVERTGCLARALLAKRQDRLWLSLVAVPLAMIIVTLQLDLWLLIPIAILCWLWASSESWWLWLLGIMEGCFGIVWAYLGVYLLAEFPHNQIAVGAGWVAYALVVAVAGGVNRWRFQRKYGW
jgi:uncharacterized membrane protein